MDEQGGLPAWDGPKPIKLENLLETLWTTLTDWLDSGVQMLPNLVLAVLVTAIAFVLADRIARLARGGLQRVTENRQVVGLAEILLRTFLRIAGLFAALAILNLDGVVTSLLAGVGVVGLALGFAFQDIAANFMSGVLMAIQRPFRVGDLIETQDYFGTVTSVDLRTTTVRTPKGEDVLLPNKDVLNNALVNFTRTPDRRVDVEVGVAYADDLRVARKAVVEALEGLEGRQQSRPVEVFFTGFGGSSIDLVARFWVGANAQRDFLSARSEAILTINDALAEAGCTIPFPIRTLDFGAGSVGGKRLDEVLPRRGPSAVEEDAPSGEERASA